MRFELKFWEQVYKFFRSVKLAIVLVLYLAITSALSTLIPQSKEISFYYKTYAPVIAWLIDSTHFYRFFKSVWFLLPIIIFFINLLVCAVDRFVRRLRSRAKKRFGPDIIHIGILLLMLGGLIRGVYGRTENTVYLSEGNSTQLPGGYVLFLESFEFLKYEDGRPKDWYSRVAVTKDNEPVTSFTLEVNRPLKIGRLKVYQSSYSQDYSADILDFTGDRITIRPGDYYVSGDSIVIFRGVEAEPGTGMAENDSCCPTSGYAVFEELDLPTEGKGHKLKAIHRVAVSEQIDDFTIERLCIWNQTGLQVVEDRSTIPVLISMILIGFGVSLTFIQKLGGKNV